VVAEQVEEIEMQELVLVDFVLLFRVAQKLL
jgi:hypothetical protein